MIRIECTGDFKNTTNFLQKAKKFNVESILERYGNMGVKALSSATPSESGVTAASWGYAVVNDSKETSITWTNNSIAGSIPIVILLQYGHGTRNGGYVSGVDFINPALKTIMNDIADKAWKEVTNG